MPWTPFARTSVSSASLLVPESLFSLYKTIFMAQLLPPMGCCYQKTQLQLGMPLELLCSMTPLHSVIACLQ